VTSAVAIAVRVTPRAAEDAISGVDEEGALRIRVRAAAEDGAANRALIQLLAAELGVHQADVRLVRGAGARRKLVELVGADPLAVTARWPGTRIRAA
jgi:uncharacterized protein